MFFKTVKRILLFPVTLVVTLLQIGFWLIISGLISVVWYFFLGFVLLLVGVESVDAITITIFCTAPVFVVASVIFIIRDRQHIFNWVGEGNFSMSLCFKILDGFREALASFLHGLAGNSR